ncbi:putative cellulose synthase (UDP-forming) [Helianthus annuus]|uniref:Cellulose synthase (UDP-forming) n=1 Tax=Helianthus annuus TaxID=4232 RepID=A0A9K3E5T8_HELAN|nr:putative cellulose synthase (UDP-forming) [Helianthus annuus]KAJ0452968.1 putative cellulose synthase (UDP-forming) [Helianthus annuus]KAJ0474882.1 putative cellulose synthase (UDP-forming) [Helianthus annuus]KAJ0650438.1 putative cellulose synthase (UDP-forming) [Helianthus annuus]KAJ0654193.1 putative cellulose synthase (UDP-forming) [Helianthus annuus]
MSSILLSRFFLQLNNGRGPYASGYASSEVDGATLKPEIPLLTYSQEDDGISADKHALIIPPFMNRAKHDHPMSVSDTTSSVSLPPRPMDPKKDLAVYGYGTVV